MLAGALSAHPVTARCKTVPKVLKLLALPLSHNPVFQAAITAIARWARELHLRTSIYACDKGQEDLLTIPVLRRLGELVIRNDNLWGPLEALRKGLDEVGWTMTEYHILKSGEGKELSMFMDSPAMVVSRIAEDYRRQQRIKVNSWANEAHDFEDFDCRLLEAFLKNTKIPILNKCR